ncbi:hypothetical protein SDC9_149072 [bioreactor metagenome]|uniref:Uncharacterized protein n=1 Tax=bioreactor metagenome TaxID=1076179 RepID=A0A645EKL6_9ZZZZ
MLARFKRFDGHPAVLFQIRIDMNRVDIRVFQHFMIIRVAFLNAQLVPKLIKFLLVAAADGHAIRLVVFLVNGDKLRPETQAHYANS